MEILEIVLILLGVIVFVGSFLLPAGRNVEKLESAKVIEESVREMVGKEVDSVRPQINEIVNETISYSVEKTERAMERLTNEKMLAINEYSDTVLEEINKHHQEIVFLYDMLNNKHDSLTATAGEASRLEGEIKKAAMDAGIAVRETEEKLRLAKASMNETLDAVKKLNQMALPAEEGAEVFAAENTKVQEETEFTPIAAERVEVIPSFFQEGDVPAYFEAQEETPEGTLAMEVSGQAKISGDTGEENGNNNEAILALHKAGKSETEIARELELGVGEVRLVIDLYEGI